MRKVVFTLLALVPLFLFSCDLNQTAVPLTGTLYGTVYDALDGDSLAEILIFTSGNVYSTTTDNYGSYSLEMEAGEYYLYATGTGYAADRDTVIIDRDSFAEHDIALYSEENGAARVYGDIYCSAADTLIPDVDIVAEKLSGYIGTSDEQGRFEFYLAPGEETVTFLHDEHQDASYDLVLDISDTEFLRVWMDPLEADTTSGN